VDVRTRTRNSPAAARVDDLSDARMPGASKLGEILRNAQLTIVTISSVGRSTSARSCRQAKDTGRSFRRRHVSASAAAGTRNAPSAATAMAN